MARKEGNVRAQHLGRVRRATGVLNVDDEFLKWDGRKSAKLKSDAIAREGELLKRHNGL